MRNRGEKRGRDRRIEGRRVGERDRGEKRERDRGEKRRDRGIEE